MKNYIFKLFIAILVSTNIISCSDDYFAKINIDKKQSSSVLPGPLFTNAVRNYADLLLGTEVNKNVLRLYAQYWAQTTYPDESQYNQTTRDIPENMWVILYKDVLKDLKGTKDLLNEESPAGTAETALQKNKLACIDIFEVLVYSTLVDLFGDVPFSEALDINNTTPKYDDAATIYTAILTNLDSAISFINTTYSGFSDSDPFYEGNMTAWKKLANSLKLRLALRLADADVAKSKSLAEAAASGVFTSNADNFSISYQSNSPNTNPLWVDLVQSGRDDYVAANTFVNELNTLNDPRRAIYFNFKADTTIYIGGIYGSANSAPSFSPIGAKLKKPDLEGILLSYAEVEFLLAEAVERGYAVGGTAKSHYDNGINASMDEWGVSTANAATYLAQASVAYTTATGTWREKIGKQKWIAMMNIPFEGWTAYRLLDFGILNAPAGMSVSDIPTRFLYPTEEATLNKANKDAASTAIGGDTKTTKLFWDKN